jgi:hypothetical protein
MPAGRLRILRLVFWLCMLAPVMTPALAESAEDPICWPLHGILGDIGAPEINAGTVSAGRIVGRGPARTLDILPDCGNQRPQSGCTAGTTPPIPAGSTVIILRSAMGYRCVSTAGGKRQAGSIGGWVLASRIAVYPKWPNAPMRSWIGTWAMEDNRLQITHAPGGLLRFVGHAVYQARNAVNEGSFDDQLRPVGGMVNLSAGSDPCSISMRLISGMLAVFDQGDQCDGGNVSFTGIYTRQRRPK